MRAFALCVSLAALMLAMPAAAQSFVGGWRATADAPDGEISET